MVLTYLKMLDQVVSKLIKLFDINIDINIDLKLNSKDFRETKTDPKSMIF